MFCLLFVFYFIFSKICFATFHSFRLQVCSYYSFFSFANLSLLPTKQTKTIRFCIRVLHLHLLSVRLLSLPTSFLCCLFVFLFPSLITAFARFLFLTSFSIFIRLLPSLSLSLLSFSNCNIFYT